MLRAELFEPSIGPWWVNRSDQKWWTEMNQHALSSSSSSSLSSSSSSASLPGHVRHKHDALNHDGITKMPCSDSHVAGRVAKASCFVCIWQPKSSPSHMKLSFVFGYKMKSHTITLWNTTFFTPVNIGILTTYNQHRSRMFLQDTTIVHNLCSWPDH